MDELKVLKLAHENLKKNYEQISTSNWEMDMVLKEIARKFIKQNSIADEFRIHLYNEANPLLKALDIKLDPKWIKYIEDHKRKYL